MCKLQIKMKGKSSATNKKIQVTENICNVSTW